MNCRTLIFTWIISLLWGFRYRSYSWFVSYVTLSVFKLSIVNAIIKFYIFSLKILFLTVPSCSFLWTKCSSDFRLFAWLPILILLSLYPTKSKFITVSGCNLLESLIGLLSCILFLLLLWWIVLSSFPINLLDLITKSLTFQGVFSWLFRVCFRYTHWWWVHIHYTVTRWQAYGLWMRIVFDISIHMQITWSLLVVYRSI